MSWGYDSRLATFPPSWGPPEAQAMLEQHLG